MASSSSRAITLGDSPVLPESIIQMGLAMTPKKERPGLLGRLMEEAEAHERETEGEEAEVNLLLDDLLKDLPVGKGKKKGRPGTVAKKEPRNGVVAKKEPRKRQADADAGPVVKREKKEAAAAVGATAKLDKKKAGKDEVEGKKKAKEEQKKKKAQTPESEELSSSEDGEEEADDDDKSSEDSGEEGDSDDEEEEPSDDSEESSDDEDDDDDGEEGENVATGPKKKVRAKKELTSRVKLLQFCQCRDCQTIQKEEVVDLITCVGEDELMLNLAMCRSCVEGNRALNGTLERYFGGGGTPKKLFVEEPQEHKKKRKPRYKAEADDYKLHGGRYIIQVGQCGGCQQRQKDLSPDIFISNGPSSTKVLGVCQCLRCLGGNKGAQSTYWKYWGLYRKTDKKKASTKGKKKNEKKQKKKK